MPDDHRREPETDAERVEHVRNVAFSAMPVTMPGSAIGRITRKLMLVAAEEVVALDRECRHRAEHEGDRCRAESARSNRGAQRRPHAPPLFAAARHHSSVNPVGGNANVRDLLKALSSTSSSGT